MAAAVIALVWANSPAGDSYTALRDTEVGPEALRLHLSLGTWAADGLLAVFFFVAGLELKREFVAGDLRDPARAALPVAAAVGGMIVPGLLYVAVTTIGGDGGQRGWGVPIATDIAFALAVLAVIGRNLHPALRTFLLTLAVVDDLLAIVVIAVFYPSSFSPVPLVLALVPLGVFTALVQRGVRAWWLLLPLAALTWGLVHASGIHATVAGVLLGFAVPVLPGAAAGPGSTRPDSTRPDSTRPDSTRPDSTRPGAAEHFEHRFRPISSGFAVPVFAFFSAGVAVGGTSGLVDAWRDPVALGVMAGLVVGKPVGILLATFGVARLTRARLDENLGAAELLGLGLLGGIGFTVSLLIGELAFAPGAPAEAVKVGVLTGSVVAALLAAVVLCRKTTDSYNAGDPVRD